jgi:hypothetical protein
MGPAATAHAQLGSYIGEGRVDTFGYPSVHSIQSDMRADYAEFGSSGSSTQFNVRLGAECCDQDYEQPPSDYVHAGFYKTRELHPWWQMYVWEQQFPATGGSGHKLGKHEDPTNFHTWRIEQRWESGPPCVVGDVAIAAPCVIVEYDGRGRWATNWSRTGSSFTRGFAGGQVLADGEDGWHFEGRTIDNRYEGTPYDGRPPGEKQPFDWVSTGSSSWRWDDLTYP